MSLDTTMAWYFKLSCDEAFFSCESALKELLSVVLHISVLRLTHVISCVSCLALSMSTICSRNVCFHFPPTVRFDGKPDTRKELKA